MMIQPNTDMTGTGSGWVGIVMLIVTFAATKSAKQIVYEIISTVIIFKVNIAKSSATP